MFDRLPVPRLPHEIGLPLLIVAGIVLLLFGWKLYRVMMVMIVVVAGGLLAAWLARTRGLWVMLAAGLPAGLIGGHLSLTFERYGVFVLGCVAGVAPVFASEAYFFSNHAMYFAALAIGLITGSLAVLFWKPGIILSLSIIGATAIERGVILGAEYFRPGLGEGIVARYNLPLSLAFLGLVLIGVIEQYRLPVLAPKFDTTEQESQGRELTEEAQG